MQQNFYHIRVFFENQVPSHKTCPWLYNASLGYGHMNTKRERQVSKNIQLVGGKMSHQIVWGSTY